MEYKLNEQYLLKFKEKEKQIEDMKEQIDELKRKSELTSQQLTGEVLELELEEILRLNFPYDQIEPVPKGIKGADIIQKVNTRTGEYCGAIVWESKRTKNWSDGWIKKLKNDQREIKADICAIVSTVLPKDVTNFCNMDGAFITDFNNVIPIASILREQLIEISKIKQSAVGKDEKIEILHNYLTSPTFKQRVEGIVESFIEMKNDLDKEKRAIEKHWAKREEQIVNGVRNIAKMYGSMQGIIGASLPEIKSLELDQLTYEEKKDGSKLEDFK